MHNVLNRTRRAVGKAVVFTAYCLTRGRKTHPAVYLRSVAPLVSRHPSQGGTCGRLDRESPFLRGVPSVARRGVSVRPPVVAVFLIGGLLLAGLGCDTGPAPSLHDPDAQGNPDPVVSSIDPAGAALAGVDILTITGQNFATNTNDNLVFFDEERGEVIEATSTQLRVLPPNLPKPELGIRIAVLGAENFSNTTPYRLDAAAEPFGSIAGFEEPFALTTDADGNLYVSLLSDGRSAGILRMAPDGTRSIFVETTFKWDGIAFGPDGLLYTARGVRALFRFAEGEPQETWAVVPTTSERLSTLDFDDQGNVWTGGNSANLYRIAPDASIEAFPFEGNVRDLNVFSGSLYVAATQDDGTSKVWRLPITDAGLGTAEEYFDVTAQYGAEAFALAFATNGDLFIGTDASDPIVEVLADGTHAALYPGILQPAAVAFAWGSGTSLFMTQGQTNETNPDLVRIETRREGAR